MTKIIICGCGGQMGKAIMEVCDKIEDIEVVAGFDIKEQPQLPYPVFTDFLRCDIAADCIINFSHPSLVTKAISYCKTKNIPLIECTTGLSEEIISLIHSASKDIPLFFSANMSLGVNLVCELAKIAAKALDGFDIEIIEKHHNQKLDAPSGTAMLIANTIRDSLDETPKYVYERESKREKRSKKEIGIHAVRGGTIVGEHDVLFCGTDEVITLSHQATSKKVFATGAVNAAKFIKNKPNGLYSMKDLIQK